MADGTIRHDIVGRSILTPRDVGRRVELQQACDGARTGRLCVRTPGELARDDRVPCLADNPPVRGDPLRRMGVCLAGPWRHGSTAILGGLRGANAEGVIAPGSERRRLNDSTRRNVPMYEWLPSATQVHRSRRLTVSYPTSGRRWTIVPLAALTAAFVITTSGRPMPRDRSSSSRRRPKRSGGARTCADGSTVQATLLVRSTRDFESPDTEDPDPTARVQYLAVCPDGISFSWGAPTVPATITSPRTSRASPPPARDRPGQPRRDPPGVLRRDVDGRRTAGDDRQRAGKQDGSSAKRSRPAG